MRKALVLISAALAGLAVAAVAFAHAEPARVSPGQDAVLNASPTEIVLEMSQEMARTAGANDIVLVDAGGATVTKQAATIDNTDRKRLSVPVPTGLPTGTYTVRWKTVSADDGDPANGSYSFKVDPAATPSAGKTVLREDSLGLQTPEANGAASQLGTGDTGGGTSWVLVSAVAIGMFVLGAGAAFLLVQKQP